MGESSSLHSAYIPPSNPLPPLPQNPPSSHSSSSSAPPLAKTAAKASNLPPQPPPLPPKPSNFPHFNATKEVSEEKESQKIGQEALKQATQLKTQDDAEGWMAKFGKFCQNRIVKMIGCSILGVGIIIAASILSVALVVAAAALTFHSYGFGFIPAILIVACAVYIFAKGIDCGKKIIKAGFNKGEEEKPEDSKQPQTNSSKQSPTQTKIPSQELRTQAENAKISSLAANKEVEEAQKRVVIAQKEFDDLNTIVKNEKAEDSESTQAKTNLPQAEKELQEASKKYEEAQKKADELKTKADNAQIDYEEEMQKIKNNVQIAQKNVEEAQKAFDTAKSIYDEIKPPDESNIRKEEEVAWNSAEEHLRKSIPETNNSTSLSQTEQQQLQKLEKDLDDLQVNKKKQIDNEVAEKMKSFTDKKTRALLDLNKAEKELSEAKKALEDIKPGIKMLEMEQKIVDTSHHLESLSSSSQESSQASIQHKVVPIANKT